MKQIAYILLMLFFPVLLWGQNSLNGKLSPYTRHFLSSLKEYRSHSLAESRLKKSFALESADNQMYINAFILLSNAAGMETIKACNVQVNTVVNNIVTARIPVDSIEALALLPDVKRLDIARPVKKKMDEARAVTQVDKVHQGNDLPHPFKGEGVIVGIVDTGFEYNHINFFSSDGEDFRIRRVWDQNKTDGNIPDGFYYGTELKTKADILLARYDRENETHATHVTGIAAGADKSLSYYGVAPQADIALVSLSEDFRDNVAILDGVKYLFDYAALVNKPCVVNLSLGMHTGPHDGTSMFDMACDELQGPGRLLVGAAGNEGEIPLHIAKNISLVDTLKTFLSFPPDAKFGYIDFWGEPDQPFKIKVFVYNRNTKAIMFASDEIDASKPNEKSYVLKSVYADGAVGLIDIYTEKNPLNSKTNAYIETFFDGIGNGNYIGLAITGENGIVHGWIDGRGASFTDNYMLGWTSGDTECTVGEVGGTGKRIITVGAYSSKNEFVNLAGDKRSSMYEAGKSAPFSSMGPTADGRMKPDVTAPGAVVVSSFSNEVMEDAYYKSLTVGKSVSREKTYFYGAMQGTSMAAPFITGILATWLEACPTMNPDDARRIFRNTSIKDSYVGEAEDNLWGCGKVDAWSGLKEAIKLRGVDIESYANSFCYAVVYSTPGSHECWVLFMGDDSNVTISVYDMGGRCIHRSAPGTVLSSSEEMVNLKNREKGIYIVSVRGDRQSHTSRLILK